MKFGLFGGARSAGEGSVGDSLGYRNFIDYVLLAEELGYESVFVVEHHFTGVGQVSASLNLLTYLAARTRSIRLGTAVVVLPWHNPALLAEQVATLDLLSDGRFDFGVGKGYRDTEFDGFCVPMSEATERFEETMAFLRKAWAAQGRFSHQGKFWKFHDIVVEPRPTQQPHPPLWMGAGSFEGITRAGENGYNLLLDQLAETDLVGQRVTTYRAAVESQGRKVTPHSIGLTRALLLATTDEERRKAYEVRHRTLKTIGGLARGPGAERYKNIGTLADANIANDDAALIGKPDEIVAKLKALESVGVDYVLLVDPTGSEEALRVFAKEVMPAFKNAPAYHTAR